MQLRVAVIELAVIVMVVSQIVAAPLGVTQAATSRFALRARVGRVCGEVPVGMARCDALVRLDLQQPASQPSGLAPSDLQDAYALPSTTAGYGQTIAIIAAYDDPNAEADLAVYRTTFGLPPCTSSTGCFRKVDERGGANYPASDDSWAREIALDLAMASATCPHCHLLLVEARDASFAHLGRAVNTAAQLGANVINNSYSAAESSSDKAYDALYFNHPGIVITASAGDAGYGNGAMYPAASPYVTAVGGTTLVHSPSRRGWSETAWGGTSSGCSGYVSKPSWQRDTGCSNRTVADVAAVADPMTGVAVYYSFAGSPGWIEFGGTSVAAPLIAGVYALAGNSSSVTYGSYPYAHPGALNDVLSGENGSCGGTYLCTAVIGYDGPTGLGTPAGVGAF